MNLIPHRIILKSGQSFDIDLPSNAIDELKVENWSTSNKISVADGTETHSVVVSSEIAAIIKLSETSDVELRQSEESGEIS